MILEDKRLQENCYTNIGNVYQRQKNYDESFKYFEKFGLSKEINDLIGIENSYFQIGLLLRMERNFEDAIQYFERVLKLQKS